MHCLIVGGGAAGLTAAGFAARRGVRVTVVERNPRMARKVMITGKGRCNLTNRCTVEEFIAHVPQNGRFLYSALSFFPPEATMAWMENLGVPLKTERGNRVFPASDKAVDVVDALVRFAREGGCRFLQGRASRLLLEGSRCTGIELETGERLTADVVVVATGGLSYPATGSTGDGFALARQAGHAVTPPRPSLVPLVSSDGYCSELQGLSLRNCALKVVDNIRQKVVFTDFGEMMFTHFGVSGPMVLSASAHMRQMEPERYTLWLDLKPALTDSQLDARLVRDLEERRNSDFGNALGGLLPRKLIPVMERLCGIPGEKKCHDITREERRTLGTLLKAFPVRIRGFRPVEEAIVTSGGVCVRELHAKTMASKKVENLYFAGEVLDVDGYTGGFNLQIAFSTGAAAGRSAADSMIGG